MPDPLRVAYLCEFPTLLGGERSLLVFLRQAGREGWLHATVLAPPNGPLADALDAAGMRRLPWPANRGQRVAEAAALLRGQVELVHGNSLMMASTARAVADSIGTPAVAHLRDMMKLSARALADLARLDRLVAVSQAVRDWYAVAGLADPSRLHVIPNAVESADLLAQAKADPRLPVDPATPLVGCIGQICLRKAQDVFLAAAARIAAAQPAVHFVVVGSRFSEKPESVAFERALQERASEPPLAGRVHFLGTRTDAPAIIRRLAVLVVPSRQEPWSRVLLEALALGTPIVAAAVGGTPELLTSATGAAVGELVPPDDADATATAVLAVLADPRAAAQRAELGRARANDFTPARQSRQLQSLYRDLLDVPSS